MGWIDDKRTTEWPHPDITEAEFHEAKRVILGKLVENIRERDPTMAKAIAESKALHDFDRLPSNLRERMVMECLGDIRDRAMGFEVVESEWLRVVNGFVHLSAISGVKAEDDFIRIDANGAGYYVEKPEGCPHDFEARAARLRAMIRSVILSKPLHLPLR